MRRQICVTLDEYIHHRIIRNLKNSSCKSKSQFIEKAIHEFLGVKK